MAITVTNPIFDQVYVIKAWQENNRTLKLVQGEGITIAANATNVTVSRAKAPRFQLKSAQGVIDLSSGSPNISWAVKRPRGGEDLLACNIVSGQAANGIIEIPITKSVTEYAGDASGEIRILYGDGSLIKFFGINACIGQGVSDEAAAQSSRFDALLDALRKVVSLQTGNVAAMDDLTSGGNLPNGTNPVASGNLKTYLEGNYLTYLGSRFVKMRIAYPDSCTDEQMTGITDGARMKDSVAQDTLYMVRGGTAITNGDFNGVMICAKYRSNSGQQTQYWLTRSGVFQYRTKANDAAEWSSTWTPIGSTQNIQDQAVTTAKLADGNITPGKLDRTYTEFKAIDASAVDSATINGIIYKVSLDGRVNYLFCVNSGTNLRTQYRFDTQGYAKYRTQSTSGGAWSDWHALVTTQNIQDQAVTTAKLANGAVTVGKLNIDDPDTLVQLLEGTAIYYHKTNNQSPATTMDVKYPIPTLWFTGTKYYMLTGRTDVPDSESYNYTINKLPANAEIAGLSLHNSISKSQLKTTLGYAEVQIRDRVPADTDIGVIGDMWAARLTDSNDNTYFELYQLKSYFADETAPTVTRYNWKKIIYSDDTNHVTVWDAATTASNNYAVPDGTAGAIGDIIIMTPSSGTGGAVWQLTKIVSSYGHPSYIWERQIFAADISRTIAELSHKVFTCTLEASSWSNSQQTVTLPLSYIPSGDTIANINISSTGLTQLIADGCTGIYLSSVYNNGALTVVAHASGNTPTDDVDVQVILIPVTDITT